jgi:hypothetical protein
MSFEHDDSDIHEAFRAGVHEARSSVDVLRADPAVKWPPEPGTDAQYDAWLAAGRPVAVQDNPLHPPAPL